MADIDAKTLSPTANVDYKGDIQEGYLNEHWTGLPTKTGIAWYFMGDGITTINPKYTDKTKTAAYYDGGGAESKTTTGVTASYDVSGDRSNGNPTQDLIANRKFMTGARRQLWFRKNVFVQNEDGSLTLTKSEYGKANFSDIDDGGGTADDNGGFKTTIQYLSTPTIVTSNKPQKLDDILHQTPSQNASILGVNVEQPQEDGQVAIYTPNVDEDEDTINLNNSRPATLDEAREQAGSYVAPKVNEDSKVVNPEDVNADPTADGADVKAK